LLRTLNIKQKKLFDIIIIYYTNEINLGRNSPLQLLLNIDRETGTKKIFIFLKVYTRIQKIAITAGRGNPVFRAAPTSIAAFNIIGKTLYNLLRLPVNTKKSDLSPITLQVLQVSFISYRFLIINKKLIIDLKTLLLIDDRLQVIFLTIQTSFLGD
jgi:hypothetical protein